MKQEPEPFVTALIDAIRLMEHDFLERNGRRPNRLYIDPRVASMLFSMMPHDGGTIQEKKTTIYGFPFVLEDYAFHLERHDDEVRS